MSSILKNPYVVLCSGCISGVAWGPREIEPRPPTYKAYSLVLGVTSLALKPKNFYCCYLSFGTTLSWRGLLLTCYSRVTWYSAVWCCRWNPRSVYFRLLSHLLGPPGFLHYLTGWRLGRIVGVHLVLGDCSWLRNDPCWCSGDHMPCLGSICVWL